MRVEVDPVIEIRRETKYLVTFGQPYAEKLECSLGRALEALGKLESSADTAQRRYYQVLVNTGTVDDLVAFRTALVNAREASA